LAFEYKDGGGWGGQVEAKEEHNPHLKTQKALGTVRIAAVATVHRQRVLSGAALVARQIAVVVPLAQHVRRALLRNGDR